MSLTTNIENRIIPLHIVFDYLYSNFSLSYNNVQWILNHTHWNCIYNNNLYLNILPPSHMATWQLVEVLYLIGPYSPLTTSRLIKIIFCFVIYCLNQHSTMSIIIKKFKYLRINFKIVIYSSLSLYKDTSYKTFLS